MHLWLEIRKQDSKFHYTIKNKKEKSQQYITLRIILQIKQGHIYVKGQEIEHAEW